MGENKRILSCMFVSILLMGMVWFGLEDGRTVKINTAWETIDEGSTGEEEVFVIQSKEDWIAFCKRVNLGEKDLNAVLAGDVDLEGEVHWLLHYQGSFDGQGYSISGTGRALFNILGEDATVENLIVKDVRIKLEEQDRNAAAVVSYNDGVVKNCQVYGYIEGSYYVGGIAGINRGKVENCVNYAKIVSIPTGDVVEWWKEDSGVLYAAGGIAGLSITSEEEEDRRERSTIEGCVNYGDITADTFAGGICGYLQGGVRRFWREDYDIINSLNYGTVTVNYIDYMTSNYTTICRVGGIAGSDYRGGFFHCGNLGKVGYAESAPRISEYGYIYEYFPQGISWHHSGHWDEEEFVVDCVNLRGTVEDSMRGEAVMEITMDEFRLWEAGELAYETNSWQFDLEEAVLYEELEPLGIEELEASKEKENYYLSDEFIIVLPEGFHIEEKRVGGELYGIHIQYVGGENLPVTKEQEEIWKGYETWLLRRETDMEGVIKEVFKDMDDYPQEEMSASMSFMDNLLWEVPRLIQIPVYDLEEYEYIYEPIQRTYSENRIFVEDAIPQGEIDEMEKEGQKVIGNIRTIVLEGNPEDGLAGKWILLHSHKGAYDYPPRDYVDTVNEGFYPLQEQDRVVEVKAGDTLEKLALRRMGSRGYIELIAHLNQLEDINNLFIGDNLLVPDGNAWSRRPAAIENSWFSGIDTCVAKDTGKKRMTVYLEPQVWQPVSDFGIFSGEETIQTLVTAWENGTLEKTLKQLNQPVCEITSQDEMSSWVQADDTTWHLKYFVIQQEKGDISQEKWFYTKNPEQDYGNFVVQGIAKDTGRVHYYIFRYLDNGATIYVDEPVVAVAESTEYYFLKSEGEYGQNDLWVVVRDENGEIEGLAGYIHGMSDREVIYLEMEEELRITRQYITWDYISVEEWELPAFLQKANINE